MKIILLVDVPKLGRKNDIKEVADGYAHNFLIPRKLAIIATPEKIKEAELKKQQEMLFKKQQEAQFREWAKKLKTEKLEWAFKADKKGKLFGSLHKKEIIEKLKGLGFQVEEKNIFLDKPIKEIGEYLIKIKFGSDIETELKIVVKAID